MILFKKFYCLQKKVITMFILPSTIGVRATWLTNIPDLLEVDILEEKKELLWFLSDFKNF